MTRLAGMAVAAALLALSTPAHADLMELKWASEGYFRTRAIALTNLAPMDRYTSSVGGEQIVIPEIRNTSYIMSRGRIMPKLMFDKIASFNLQIDIFDDVLWGDNNGLATAPLFATDTTNQYFLGGGQVDSIVVDRAWVEFQIPVGLMRVGRMPSHWGLGLLANGGGTANIDPLSPVGYPARKAADHFFDDDFGDNHFGSTTDRILFVTKPLSIVKTIQKKANTESGLIVGYAFDKLSEAPLFTAEPFERRFRPFGQQGFISRGKNDDVNEHVALAVWTQPLWDPVAYTDELKVGVYGVIRTAEEGSTNPTGIPDPTATCGEFEGEAVPCVDTGSTVFITDLWWKLRWGKIYTEGEIIKIFGETFGGVPFPSTNRKKKADITGGAIKVGYLDRLFDVVLEVGHASGDEYLEDEHFKQRALHPDYNVGLILFEQTLRELSARTYGVPFLSEATPNGATGLFSNGGVVNANYIFPHARWRPGVAGFEFVGAVLMAWVDEKATTGTAMFYEGDADSSYLGTEFDVAAKTNFSGHMQLSLESGLLLFGDALKAALPNADSSFTLQARLAFVW